MMELYLECLFLAALCRAARGRGIIVSSGARSAFELRGPYDVMSLVTLCGLTQQQAKVPLTLSPSTSAQSIFLDAGCFAGTPRLSSASVNMSMNVDGERMVGGWCRQPCQSGVGMWQGTHRKGRPTRVC